MDDTIDLIKKMAGMAWRCIFSYHYFNLTTGHEGNFWVMTQNNFGESVCLLWVHMFGNRSDDHHYQKLLSDDNIRSLGSDFSTEAAKQRLLEATSLTDQGFQKLWEDVKTCRDKFIAHRDNSADPIIFPDIEK